MSDGHGSHAVLLPGSYLDQPLQGLTPSTFIPSFPSSHSLTVTMALFRAPSHSSAGNSDKKSTAPSSANEMTPLTASRAESSSPGAASSNGAPQEKKPRFGFSEVAKLFIKMRRHRRRASVSQAAPQDGAEDDSPTSGQPVQSGSNDLHQVLSGSTSLTLHSGRNHAMGVDDELTPPATPCRTPSPPTSPRRVQIRHFGPHSIFHRDGKANKPHHLYSSSGDQPITHPGMKESALLCPALPVEYTDRFECVGGVNAVTLLRATRNTLLETVGDLGWNALVDET